jgi:hypothetical protein
VKARGERETSPALGCCGHWRRGREAGGQGSDAGVATAGWEADVAPILTREKERRRVAALGRTKGERENHGAREEIDRRKWAPRFSQN